MTVSAGHGDLAERVLLALTRYHVVGDSHAAVEIFMSAHDVRVLGSVSVGGVPVNEASWVVDGHPEVQITVTT